MVTIVVIDGQGGGVGKSLVEQIRKAIPKGKIIAVGSNAAATSNMMKAGADAGATGENAVLYNCRYADIVTGPIGIVLANSMLGEITGKMAYAVSDCDAKKILIPASKCPVSVVGLAEKPLGKYIEEAVSMMKAYVSGLDSH